MDSENIVLGLHLKGLSWFNIAAKSPLKCAVLEAR